MGKLNRESILCEPPALEGARAVHLPVASHIGAVHHVGAARLKTIWLDVSDKAVEESID